MEDILRTMIGDLIIQIAQLRAQNIQLQGALEQSHRDKAPTEPPLGDSPQKASQPVNGATAP